MKSRMLAAVAAAALTAGSAHAATWVFSNLDADKNLELVVQEFRPLARHIFRAWDADRDNRAEPRDFYRNLHGWWDLNADGRLDQNEYTSGWRDWGRGFNAPGFAGLDANNDGFIARSEFATGLLNSGYFATWDTNDDDFLSRNEFQTALFEVWDKDRNGILNSNEFAAWQQPLARLANPIEPSYDPIDTAAEPTRRAVVAGTNRAEPSYDPIDTAAEPRRCRALIARTNRIEPGYDPIDTAAEPARRRAVATTAATNRIEPGYDPIDTAAEPNVRLPLLTRPVALTRIDEQQVYNLRGEELGEVESVRCGPDGQLYAVIAFNEFLGLGGTHRIVPLGRMFFANDRMVLPGITEVEAATFPRWTGANPDRGLFEGYYTVTGAYSIPMRYTAWTLPAFR